MKIFLTFIYFAYDLKGEKSTQFPPATKAEATGSRSPQAVIQKFENVTNRLVGDIKQTYYHDTTKSESLSHSKATESVEKTDIDRERAVRFMFSPLIFMFHFLVLK